jgi:hypothetical protein
MQTDERRLSSIRTIEDLAVFQQFFRCSATLIAILLATACARRTQATGYWNLPSTFCQCIGCGYGAGHHAPFILGPITADGWLAANEYRLPHAPSSSYNGCDYGENGWQFAEPTIMEPSPQPGAPALVPITRKHRPLFLR